MSFWKDKNDTSSTSVAATVSPPKDLANTAQPASPANNSKRTADLEDSLSEKYGKVRSALGPGTVIQGRLSFDTPVRIDGTLSGDISSSEAVIVGATGKVEAEIHVSSLIVLGWVKGNIFATKRVEVLSGGRVEGSVTSPVLVIEEGCQFNGTSSMSSTGVAPSKRESTAKGSTAAERIGETKVVEANDAQQAKEALAGAAPAEVESNPTPEALQETVTVVTPPSVH